MATMNPFDLLGDDDSEDPSQLIAAQQKALPKKEAAQKKEPARSQAAAQPAKLPSKPLPPAQAVREAKTESGRRGGERGYARGSGYGRGGFNRDLPNESSFGSGGFSGSQGGGAESDVGKPSERRGGYSGPRNSFRSGRRDFGNGEVGDGERPRRPYERRSGTGRGVTEEVVDESEKNVAAEKPLGEEVATDVNKEAPVNEPEVKEPEDKEMTLQEYEKVLEEKRKALQPHKTEERKVDADKEFASMQPLSNKRDIDDIFVKLGSDKRKELVDKEEKVKKSVSINEFFKQAEGEKYYSPGGRRGGRGGRGGRGPREGYVGGGGRSGTSYRVEAPKIEDPGQFPTLGGK